MHDLIGRRSNDALLNHYHETLLAHGMAGYTRGALDQDYRRSVLWHITKPVWQWSINIPPLIWWNNLERVMMAVDDLGLRGVVGVGGAAT